MKTNIKTKVLLFILLMAGGAAKAQNANLPLENTAWVHFFKSAYHDSTYYQVGIKGDTAVNDVVYHKVIDCPNLGFPIEGRCFGGIRQDGNGKCYFMCFENQDPYFGEIMLLAEEGVEYPIYDFNLSECDSFPFFVEYSKVVFQIDQTEINGSVRKVFRFGHDCEDNDYHDDRWIEGIGSYQGLFYPIQALPLLIGAQYRLVEVLQDGERFYIAPEFENTDYTAIPESDSFEDKVSLYPNPIVNYGILDFSQLSSVERLDIISVDGRIIKSVNVKGLSSYEINKKDFGSGMFIFVLSDKNSNIVKGKIFIQ